MTVPMRIYACTPLVVPRILAHEQALGFSNVRMPRKLP